MNFIVSVIGIPLGFVIHLAFRATGSYGLAILIFAAIVAVVLFPVRILAHKNSIRLLQIQPALDVLKKRYAGDFDGLNEARQNLFKKEQYSPFLGMIPLFIQLFLVMGMLQVMYHPLQHIFRLDTDTIDILVYTMHQLHDIQAGTGEQLRVIESIQQMDNLHIYQEALAYALSSVDVLYEISTTRLYYFGVNLGVVPSLVSVEMLVVLLSGFSAFIFCLVQSKYSPGALSQSGMVNISLIVFTVLFSFYFAFVTPTGVGVYWSLASVFGIVAIFILNILYDPRKIAKEALAQLESTRQSHGQIKKERENNKRFSKMEKKYVSQFQRAEKQLVFYAISGGQYKFYRKLVEYVLENSNITIHYLTNDPNDKLLNQQMKNLVSYYVGQRRAASLLMKLDACMLVTTVPGLQSFHMKRSIIRKDIEYVYVPHGFGSMHLVTRENAYDHFDTIFCVGPHQAAEVRRREEIANLPAKTLVSVGYGLYDQLIESHKNLSQNANKRPKILIAPSWQPDNICDICIEGVLDGLIGRGFEIIVRPHPQYVQMFPRFVESLEKKYASNVSTGEIVLELDFLNNNSIFTADVLITDWSGISFEFSFSTLKPCVFINTPMKVLNKNYKAYGLDVLEIVARDKIGISIDVDKVDTVGIVVSNLLSEKDEYDQSITKILHQYLYHPGRSGEAGGKYIIKKIGVVNNVQA